MTCKVPSSMSRKPKPRQPVPSRHGQTEQRWRGPGHCSGKLADEPRHSLKNMEAGTGIEPVFTDLQSAA